MCGSCSNKNYCSVSKQIMIWCLDMQEAFSCPPLICISSIKVMNTYSADSVKQAKKQEVFSVIQSCRRGYREGSIFWTEL